jgi:hypothetical protein
VSAATQVLFRKADAIVWYTLHPVCLIALLVNVCMVCSFGLYMQDVVSQLLAAGANPNARDSLMTCPLLAAVRQGHLGVVSRLVAAGANMQLPPAEVASALCNAVACGDRGLVQCYLEAGADAAAVDHCGQCPLHVAAANDKLDMVSPFYGHFTCCLIPGSCL